MMNPGEKVLVFNGHNLPMIGRLVGYAHPSQAIVQLGMAEKSFWIVDIYPYSKSGKQQILSRLDSHAIALAKTIKQMENEAYDA